MNPPDWLAKRGGSLKQNYDQISWYVMFANEPQYLVKPVPSGGKHGVEIMQTINGKRLDSKNTYPTSEAALQGGLDEIRQVLGW